MIIGTIKEKKKFENRVAISPDEVKNYVKAGHQVLIEKNAGLLSGFTDKSYKEAGASIASAKEILSSSDIVVKINCPSSDEAKQLKSSSMVISQLNTQNEVDTIKIFNSKKTSAFSSISLDFCKYSFALVHKLLRIDILPRVKNKIGSLL